MRKSIFCLLIAALAWSSCSNEFDVNAEFAEFGVVYGLLDLSKSRQFIRVNKAFLDDIEPIQSATDIASSSIDSIYFSENISVSMDEFNPNGAFTRTIVFDRMSGSEAGLGPKEEGLFNNTEFFIYVTDEEIRSGHRYDLTVITDGGNELTSSTSLADDFNIAIPIVTLENDALSNEYEIAAFDNVSLAWERANNATIYDVVMRINIDEFNTADVSPARSYFLDWPVASNIRDNQTGTFANLMVDFQYESFLTFLQNQLDPDPSVFRVIERLEIIISAGTEELEQFRDVSLASGSNLNAGQARPIFSNIENGIGVFASINEVTRTVLRLSNNTEADIACNEITGDLNFVPDPTPPGNFSAPCP